MSGMDKYGFKMTIKAPMATTHAIDKMPTTIFGLQA
eukprot:CAMPEP_0169131974 /NCGR_PEP_ID=MMETSP1015-20121227/38542_1 /TAXON_ID=342587 /ORGANISM="Karlodinium micrum, Strain CCMP2283" /LENGTH=35 /DNA_ID= /DNA_START= /DNA_END= /DNA_ORIENTATION=